MSEVKVIDDNFNKELFNSLAKHPVQSWEWGEARSDMGVGVLRFVEYENENPIHSFTCLFHALPLVGKSIGYLGMCHLPSKAVLQFIQEIAKEKGLPFVKIEPYVFYDEEVEFENEDYDIRLSPTPLFYKWTLIIDLSKGEEEILQSFKKPCRYSIRDAEKKGVVVRQEDTEEGVEKFTRLLESTSERQGFGAHPASYYKKVWEKLGHRIAHIFIGYKDENPVGAFEMFYFNGRYFYPYAGNDYLYRNLNASNLIMWDAIKYGKSIGAKDFDMWGTNPPGNEEHSAWQGFSKFKESFGGQYKELLGSYDLVINPTFYSFYNLAYKLRKLLLNVKRTLRRLFS